MAGGAAAAKPLPPARGGGRRQNQATSLPFDVMVDIAACSDPATLVRFATTCREARHRVADDPAAFRRRLRLRHAGRFVLPLLRGHFIKKVKYDDHYRCKEELWLVDTSEADDTSVVKVDRGLLASCPGGKDLTELKPASSRGGLLLVRATNKQSYYREELLVCNMATRRSQILPRRQQQQAYYYYSNNNNDDTVLLVGDGETGSGEVGRPFQVLKASIVTSKDSRSNRYLKIQTFSSEHGVWGPSTKFATPNLLGVISKGWSCKPLVVNGVVHLMCLTNAGSYVVMLNVKAGRVTLTTLPTKFPRAKSSQQQQGYIRYLLATDSLCGNLIVLVADDEKISMWVQSKHTKIWKEQPHVVIKNEDILRFDNVGNSLGGRQKTVHAELLWFSETSGAVLLKIRECGFFWLDLQSKKIVRWLSNRQQEGCSVNWRCDRARPTTSSIVRSPPPFSPVVCGRSSLAPLPGKDEDAACGAALEAEETRMRLEAEQARMDARCC
ncbi:hypothetical protein QOZ80_3AG0241990 [Eleusine coracana subsp. coracana]|nr:hypothetical protein QOZ80_3AG0241990 [Eleusine coracana subsp. coracana]